MRRELRLATIEREGGVGSEVQHRLFISIAALITDFIQTSFWYEGEPTLGGVETSKRQRSLFLSIRLLQVATLGNIRL